MLELGAELDGTVNPIEINMILNDADILYKNHIRELILPPKDETVTLKTQLPVTVEYLPSSMNSTAATSNWESGYLSEKKSTH